MIKLVFSFNICIKFIFQHVLIVLKSIHPFFFLFFFFQNRSIQFHRRSLRPLSSPSKRSHGGRKKMSRARWLSVERTRDHFDQSRAENVKIYSRWKLSRDDITDINRINSAQICERYVCEMIFCTNRSPVIYIRRNIFVSAVYSMLRSPVKGGILKTPDACKRPRKNIYFHCVSR